MEMSAATLPLFTIHPYYFRISVPSGLGTVPCAIMTARGRNTRSLPIFLTWIEHRIDEWLIEWMVCRAKMWDEHLGEEFNWRTEHITTSWFYDHRSPLRSLDFYICSAPRSVPQGQTLNIKPLGPIAIKVTIYCHVLVILVSVGFKI